MSTGRVEEATLARGIFGEDRSAMPHPPSRHEAIPLPVVVPDSPLWPPRVGRLARDSVECFGSCTQSILLAVFEELGIASPEVMKAAGGFHAGMLVGGTCGVYTAGVILLGLLMGREDPLEGGPALLPIAEPARQLHRTLLGVMGSDSCRELRGGFPPGAEGVGEDRAHELSRRCQELVEIGATAIAQTLQRLVEEGYLMNPDPDVATT